MESHFRTLLVIGEDKDKIASKYSLDTKVEKYLRYKFDEAADLHKKYLLALELQMKAYKEKKLDAFVDYYQDMYEESSHQDDFEFYRNLTEGCWYDEDGNAWSTENTNAHYQYQKCYDDRIRKDQRNEATFSNPFILKDGAKAYSATKGEIDWDKVHMPKDQVDLNKAAWDICVNNREPQTDIEKQIYESMHLRNDYFANFKDEDEFVKHQCAFWTYGVATEDWYKSGEQETALDWTKNFYDTYIVPLSDDTRLSIYEIKLL